MTTLASSADEPVSQDRSHDDVGSDTLASLLKTSLVPMTTLRERHGPLLDLVRALIGVVPKCDEYLEIWPPAFVTYNIIVPNFLNLPSAIFGLGGAPADVLGLGLYVASRVAECPYCSAHTCSFALRRGASPEKVARALVGDGAFTPAELATIAVARSLARVPCELHPSEREALERCLPGGKAEWIVAGICMMGFLNKFMDAAGVELEASAFAETSSAMGEGFRPGKAGRDLDPNAKAGRPPPVDTIWTKLGIVPLLPYALRTDRRWQRGMPNRWPAVGAHLRELTGHDFPLLSRLRHPRVIQSIGSMLRENLDASTSVLGLELKVLAGAVFAAVVGDAALERDVRALGPKQGVSGAALDAAVRFAVTDGGEPSTEGPRARAVLRLAKAASPSPAQIDGATVLECRQAELSPESLVELVCWLSVLQLVHRLSCYFPPQSVESP